MVIPRSVSTVRLKLMPRPRRNCKSDTSIQRERGCTPHRLQEAAVSDGTDGRQGGLTSVKVLPGSGHDVRDPVWPFILVALRGYLFLLKPIVRPVRTSWAPPYGDCAPMKGLRERSRIEPSPVVRHQCWKSGFRIPRSSRTTGERTPAPSPAGTGAVLIATHV